MATSLIGQTLGRYKIVEQLGKGGMAEVYKGYQESLDRHVAVKIMHTFLNSEEGFLKRFQREAKAMASLSHPNIVSVYDFDTYGDDSYYLVMELISGGTLKEYLEDLNVKGERPPLNLAIRVCIEIADALAYAHRRQMVHRDIKPANVMLDGENKKAILTDFGIVKMVGNQSMAYTATGALIGTPAYMSPEQALGKPGDERVDIYSLGVMLFQMVTGQLPFSAETPLAVVMQHVSDLPPMPMEFNPDVPLDLQEVILKALAKEPDDRYQSAKEMADALRAVNLSGPLAASLAGNVPATTPSSPTVKGEAAYKNTLTGARLAGDTEPGQTQTAVDTAVPPPPQSRSPFLYVGLGVVALLIIGGILFATGVFGGEQATPTTEVVIAPDPTETDVPEETAVPTDTPTPEPTEIGALDAVRTVNAEVALTRAAEATNTPTQTATPTLTPTVTPTPDLTADFLASCVEEATITRIVQRGFSSNRVPVNQTFTLQWTLENSGTCPWPAGLVWTYDDGDELGFDGDEVTLAEAVNSGEQVNLTATLGPIASTGTYQSSWQLVDESGDEFGDSLSFEVQVVVPPTQTPVPPTRTPTPEAATVGDDWRANWIRSSTNFCEYIGIDWRCIVEITPYIDGTGAQGAQGQFTVLIFDQPGGQAATYRGVGPFSHTVLARRCSIYNTTIRVIDDVTGTEAANTVLSVNPNDHFPGGCVEN